MNRRRMAAALCVGAASLAACTAFEAGDSPVAAEAGAPDSSTLEAGADEASTLDGATGADGEAGAARRCSPTAAFDAPQKIENVGIFTEVGGLRASDDELDAYVWTQQRPPGPPVDQTDLFHLHRATTGDAFEVLSDFGPLNSSMYSDAFPTLAAEGLTIYFHRGDPRSPDKPTSRVLMTAKRATTTVAFGAPTVAVTGGVIGDGSDDANAWLSADGQTLFFSSFGRPGGASNLNYDIFQISTTAGSAAYAQVPGLNTPQTDSSAVFADDDRVVFFKSKTESDTNYRIFTSRRASKAVGFDPPVAVTELATDHDVSPHWVSSDGCILYYSVRDVGEFRAMRKPL